MKTLAKLALLTTLSLTSLSSFADTIQTLTIGALPATVNYGNSYNRTTTTGTFTDSLGGSFGNTAFYDDFIFTIPDGITSVFTSSLSFANVLGLDNLRARIYTGSTHQTTPIAPGELAAAWGNTFVLSPFSALTTVILNPTNLSAGTYTLQIKGNIIGTNGGSYAGVLNIAPPSAPVPEPETYGMLVAGLSIVGAIARRKTKKAS